jgi:hypothetical protein
MTKPPTTDLTPDNLPSQPEKRHQALVGLFGKYLFWIRQFVLGQKEHLVESPGARNQLGKIFQKPYEKMASLGVNEQMIAYEFSKVCIDAFAKELLLLLGNEGVDLEMGNKNAIRFRLQMEIVDKATGNIILEETLNRGGKFFPEYWSHWVKEELKET